MCNRCWATMLGVFIALISGLAHPQRTIDDGVLIEDITLISPERAAPLPHADIVIRDGRIAEISTKLVAGPHTRRINGGGKFLIPGLIDSHVHVGHSAALDDDAIDAHPELWKAYRVAGSTSLSGVRFYLGRRSRSCTEGQGMV